MEVTTCSIHKKGHAMRDSLVHGVEGSPAGAIGAFQAGLRLERATGTFSRCFAPRPCRSTPTCSIHKKGHAMRDSFVYGVEGSRTPVQKPVHRPSTIIVHLLRFPPPDSDRRLSGFGSFILRTYAQSFAYAVSCLFDAGLPGNRYPGPTAASA